jgi:Flp pilus assembly protein TadD
MATIAALLDLGLRHHQSGQLAQAESLYRQALLADPDQPDALHLLGNLAYQAGHHEAAIDLIQRALRGRADFVEAHYNLGNIFRSQGRLPEAIARYCDAVRLRPQFAQAQGNLSCALTELGELEAALVHGREAVRLAPQAAEGHSNLGSALAYLGQLDEAASYFAEAVRLNPNYATAHKHLGSYWLLKGDFERGWPEYEWRLRCRPGMVRSFAEPSWDGSNLHGRTILLHAEQGLGDSLQFIRYAPLVKERGGQVLLECPAELVGVVGTCAGIDGVIAAGHPLPPFDCHLPLLSLPFVLKTTLARVPAAVPYLSADPKLIEYWRQELQRYPGFKVGIVWQGNPRFGLLDCQAADQRRSIPLAQFEALAQIPGVKLFSLQKGFGTEQLAQWRAPSEIVDLEDKLADFTDTAAIMMNLDLIISADTSPLHLAGALGRPAWAVLPFAGCWRWMLEREDSPWYPTMRLFRQAKAGAWKPVFERIAQEIQSLRTER